MRPILFAIGALLSTSAMGADISSRETLAEYDEGVPFPVVYLNGVYAGWAVTNAELVRNGQKPLFCVARDRTFTPKEISETFRDFLKLNLDKYGDYPPSVTLYFAC